MEKRDLIKEAAKISKWEKIDNGIHDFKVMKIENRLTDKSKRDAIVYSGLITNSKGLEQDMNVVDVIDNDESFKFGLARLFQFIQHFGGSVDGINSLEEAIIVANQYLGETIKIEFVKKLVNGVVVKEKVFVFKK